MAKTKILKIKGDWQEVVDDCRVTVSKPPLGKEPSEKFKKEILIAEHGPIRNISVRFLWESIPYCIAMHWKTHHWESKVNTQRPDRTEVTDRSKRSQTDPVNFVGEMNAQHEIDTMRKRLCFMADPDTRELAEDYKMELRPIQPEMSDVLVPNCVYRCGCPEMGGCQFWGNFLRWAKDGGHVDPRLLPIQGRYDLYNEYFYGMRGEKRDEN